MLTILTDNKTNSRYLNNFLMGYTNHTSLLPQYEYGGRDVNSRKK